MIGEYKQISKTQKGENKMSEQEKKENMTPEEEDAKKNDSAAKDEEEKKSDDGQNNDSGKKDDKDSKKDDKSFGQKVSGFFGAIWKGIKGILPFAGAFAGGALAMLLGLVFLGSSDEEQKEEVIDIEARDVTPIEDKKSDEKEKESVEG